MRSMFLRSALVAAGLALSCGAIADDILDSMQRVPLPAQIVLDAPTLSADVAGPLDNSLKAFARHAANDLPALLRKGDAVLVEIRLRRQDTSPTQVTEQSRFADALTQRGISVRHLLGDSLIEAWVPSSELESLAADTRIASIAPARLVQPLTGSSLSQGVAASHADLWQAAGLTGSGIAIAMIDSYDNDAGEIPALQASGDWPPAARLTLIDEKSDGAFGSNSVRHGSATMEIAYDMAPGATYRAYDTVTVSDWYYAILDAANVDRTGAVLGPVKANVISVSLAAPFDGIGDGSAAPGSIAEAAGFAKARGVMVVNAAGNERLHHWGGLFSPSSSDATLASFSGANTPLNILGPGDGTMYCIANGTNLTAQLYWDDWTNVNRDYELVLYRYSGSAWSAISATSGGQSGNPASQSPTERLSYTAAGANSSNCSSGAPYAFAIRRDTAGAVNTLQLFVNANLSRSVAASSLTFPADSANVVSVAAVDKTTSNQETYSSEGPVLAPGGGMPTTSNAASDSRAKPDIASFANVNTVSYGAGVFNGTSAATPHVAGMVALLMQHYGVSTDASQVDALKTTLQSIAITGSNDRGTVGRDYQYGYGRLRFQKETTLKFLTQPSNVGAGAAISPSVKVGVYDDESTPLPVKFGIYSPLALVFGNDGSGGSATLSHASADVVNGEATYTALSIDKPGLGYSLKATAGSLPSVTSNLFAVTLGGAAKLAFVQSPTTTTSGATMSPAVTVQVQDAAGNVILNSKDTVTLSIAANPGSGTLGGTVSVAAVNGVAMFNSLSIDKAGSGYTLSAASGNLSGATSAAFDIVHGAASQLAFASVPASASAGSALSPAVTVQVQDAHGNLVTNSSATVALALSANPVAATLGGTTTGAAVNGVVSFSSLSIDVAATGYRFGASASGLTTATSASFDITAGAPARLLFDTTPSSTTAGTSFGTIAVHVQDAHGNRVTHAASSVSVSLNGGSAGASLAGTTTATVVDGVASFGDLSVAKAGAGYTLSASSGSLSSVLSPSFDIAAGAAAKLTVLKAPGNVRAGQRLGEVQVAVQDALGNTRDADSSTTIALSVVACGGPMSVAPEAVVKNGIATFAANTSPVFYRVASGYTLSASAAALTAGSSATFDVMDNTDMPFAHGFEECRL